MLTLTSTSTTLNDKSDAVISLSCLHDGILKIISLGDSLSLVCLYFGENPSEEEREKKLSLPFCSSQHLFRFLSSFRFLNSFRFLTQVVLYRGQYVIIFLIFPVKDIICMRLTHTVCDLKLLFPVPPAVSLLELLTSELKLERLPRLAPLGGRSEGEVYLCGRTLALSSQLMFVRSIDVSSHSIRILGR